ncbi:MAG: type I glyceraldehyde-3-phosphate dehydrogenase [Firmicutes bacterium]|nr:type I glyceraldehyde-3-phosphate dehydrogenase [Bacillota bacterium]
MIRVAINGFGRIGRIAFREMITGVDFDIVAINDLSNAEELAHLVKYDTIHRTFHDDAIKFEDAEIVIAGKKRIKVFAEKDPVNLPWRDLNIDLVLECTGAFTKLEDARKHIEAGSKKVLISAPGKGDMKTVVYGVNENILTGNEEVVSASSCTTNCLAPLLKVINDNFGIEKGFMTTVHAFTNDQVTLDISHKKGIYARRGRAASQNIIPASTGAASSVGLVIPELMGRMDGVAYRVPVPDGSLVDVTLELKSNPTVEEINEVFRNNQSEAIKITNDPVVSSDIIGKRLGGLVDGLLTNSVEVDGKKLYKIVAWYDNELGYTSQMLRTAKSMFKY